MFPRSGLPPVFHNWEAFEDYIGALVASGSIPDYSWCWWDARPHQKFGTVELRAPDAQTDVSYTVALAALVQCLVASAGIDEQPPENPLFNSENKWRAVRYGMDADFYDFATGMVVPARSMARRLVEELRPVARDLGCEEELGSVLEIVELGTGAELQRAAHKRSGSLEGVMDYLTQGTAPS
jgi:carboxylate-amine ligase